MRRVWALGIPVAVLAIAAGGILVFAHRAQIAPIGALPAAASFAAEEIKRGANLAAIGGCSDCHTAPGAAYLAGGNRLHTPFGALYSTNITPAPASGIGRWSEQAFVRAMREGVDRQGRHLYPAFPYDHFTRITGGDLHALYVYLMSRDAIETRQPRNELWFPFNLRPLIAVWKWMYFNKEQRSGGVRSNRGAYLADAVAHCGACHTGRNALGAETGPKLAGGEVDGWTAYAIDQASPAPVAWTAESLNDYLRHGWHPDHGVSRGPMTAVTSSLARADENDVRAIAAYIAALMQRPAAAGTVPVGPVDKKIVENNPGNIEGAAVFDSACRSCHDGSRPLPFGGITFDRSSAVNAPDARNLLNVVLYGLPPADGKANPVMPGFKGAIGDPQLGALLRYLRSRFSAEPAWRDVETQIKHARRGS